MIFLKTRRPIEPAPFVRAICEDFARDGKRRTKFVQRLSPVTLVGHASEKGLGHAAAQVLGPHFHQEASASKKVMGLLCFALVASHAIGLAFD